MLKFFMKNKGFIIVIICLLSGCAWLPLKKNKMTPVVFVESKAQKISLLHKFFIWKQKSRISKVASIDKNKFFKAAGGSKVVNAERLREGGNIVIIPFKAGAGVEANEELNKISFHMVKGISDFLKEHSTPFNVLFSENAQEADLILEGHITGIKDRSKFRKWTFQNNGIEMSIKGRLVDRKTGVDIVIFSEIQKINDTREDHKDLGYYLGRQMGKILTDI